MFSLTDLLSSRRIAVTLLLHNTFFDKNFNSYYNYLNSEVGQN